MKCGWTSKVALLLLLAATADGAVTKTVRATGRSLVVDGDRVGAFEQAKQTALRQAVEEGVGTLVTAATQVRNFELIDDFILTQTAGYVRSYAIVEEGVEPPHTYKVQVEAVVDLGQINRRLAALDILNEEMGKPRLIPIGAAKQWGGTDLAGALSEHLLQVYPSVNLLAPAQAANLAQARRLAGQQQGDILLWVTGQLAPAGPMAVPFGKRTVQSTGWQSVQGTLQLSAHWVDSGVLIARLDQATQGADTHRGAAQDRALQAALTKLAGGIMDRLAEDWRQKLYSGRTLRLVVHGSDKMRQLFELGLPSRGVERLYPRSITPQRSVYDARLRGGPYLLARQLSTLGFEGVNIEILTVGSNTLDVRLTPSLAEG